MEWISQSPLWPQVSPRLLLTITVRDYVAYSLHRLSSPMQSPGWSHRPYSPPCGTGPMAVFSTTPYKLSRPSKAVRSTYTLATVQVASHHTGQEHSLLTTSSHCANTQHHSAGNHLFMGAWEPTSRMVTCHHKYQLHATINPNYSLAGGFPC